MVHGYAVMSRKFSARKWTASFLCWLLVFVAACETSETGVVPALPVLVRQAPAEVVQAFLEAWNASDYASMYALVSAQSRSRYPQSVFEARYQQVNEALGISGITYILGETTLQGITAAVLYDVNIESPGFETLQDSGRIMRLIDEGGNWRVAWSSMDILAGYADGAQIDVQAPRPPRGSIYDRNGQPLVQENGAVVAMWSSQQSMSDVEGCIDLLARLLRQWRPSVAQRFSANNFDTIFYLGEMDIEMYAQNNGDLQTICGVAPGTNLFYEYTRRRYDWNGAAVHITGYLGQVTAEDIARGYSTGDLIGQAGVERAFEEELSGTPARVVRIIEPGGTTIRELVSAEGAPATSVTLTIDRDLQRVTAQAISDAFNYAAGNWAQFSPGAAAIVMDVNTGAILALASYPGFDPALFDPNSAAPDRGAALNALNSSQLRRPLSNLATQETYFPGSTFKIVTTAAALAEGLIRPTDSFDCQLRWDGRPYGDSREFRIDWRLTDELDPAGLITPSQALAASCNPFYYQHGALLYQDVRPQALMDYAQRMGFGAATGLEPIMREAPAPLPTIDSAEESIMSAVGQFDVQVTAVQMVRMMAGVANGGTLYRPYIVQRVGGTDGQPVTFEAQPTVVGNMDLAPEVLQVVQEGLCLATTVPVLGTSSWVFGEEYPYTICGKTGTAQTGAPYPNGWFVAYAPRENPQVAIVVVVPSSREGSETAAPIVRRILDYYFNVPVTAFPEWWFTDTYNVLDLPEGSTGG